MWPAVILAASRNDRVSGRTAILDVSIRTRNGFSQSGAPSGKKWAVDALGDFENDEIINLIHRGRPMDRVIIRCLVRLNIYGIIPTRFVMIIKRKIDVIISENPFNILEFVR